MPVKQGAPRANLGVFAIDSCLTGVCLRHPVSPMVQWPINGLARLEGLEPSTLGLEGRCSIQLSYRRSVPSV